MAKGATHVLGLDIGNDSIKLVELALTSGGVRLVSEPALIPTPVGAVSGGVVVDSASIAGLLRAVVAEKRMGVGKTVASVGGDTSVVARVISMPRMTGKELEEAMQWELDRQTPFPVDQVIYDFVPLPVAEGAPESENMDVFLAVGQEDMINAHVAAIQEAKLVPLHIGVEPLALARSLLALPGGKYMEQTVIVIDCGSTFTGIYIFRAGWPSFLRTIPTAGESLTEAIREQLGTEREQAEQAKRQFADVSDMAYAGAPEESSGDLETGSGEFESIYEESTPSEGVEAEVPEDLETVPATELEIEALLPPPAKEPAPPPSAAAPSDLPAEVQQAREMVGEAISQRIYDLVTEVSRSLDFYRRQHREEALTEIILCGGSAHLKGLPELLQGETGVLTRVANPFEHLITDGVTTAEYLDDIGPNMAVAVGLALRDSVD